MSHAKLTAYQREALPKVLSYMKENPGATQADIKAATGIGSDNVAILQRYVMASEAIEKSEKFEAKHTKLVDKATIEVAAGEKPYLSSEEYLIRENARLTRQNAKVKLDLDAEKKMRIHLSENHAGYDELL